MQRIEQQPVKAMPLFISKSVLILGILLCGLSACSDNASQSESELNELQTSPNETTEEAEELAELEEKVATLDAQVARSEAEIEVRQNKRDGKPLTFADDIKAMQRELASFYTYESARGTVLILHDLSFSPQSSDLSERGQSALIPVATILLKHPLRQVAIEGHADSQGDIEANKKLSLVRAHAVRDALVAAGVNVRRMLVQGYGSEYPTHSNDTYEGRQRNRRVEILISNSLGAVPQRN